MSLLKILSSKEEKKFETPPVFRSKDRKKFFRMTQCLVKEMSKIKDEEVKVGLLLHYGYFGAKLRFFGRHDFHKDDICYLINHLGFSFSIKHWRTHYTRKHFHRHKLIILALYGKHTFSSKKDDFQEYLRIICRRITSPSKIFHSIIDWLKKQQIEIPSYHLLCVQISKELLLVEKELAVVIKKKYYKCPTDGTTNPSQ